MLVALTTAQLIGIIIGLLMLSAFFSSAETGLMALNRIKLKNDAKYIKGARLAYRLLQKPDRLIGIILIGNNFINILATALTTLLAIKVAGEQGIVVGTALLTVAILIFAEITPKTYAAIHPERIGYPAAYVLTPLLKMFWPLVWLINLFTNSILR